MLSSKERMQELQERLNSGEELTDSEASELIILQQHHGNKGNEQKLTISIDTSKELEDLRKRLEDAETKNKDYEEKLKVHAEGAFLEAIEDCKRKGYEGQILSVEDLKKAQAELGIREAGSKAGGQTPLSPLQTGQTGDDKQYFSSRVEALTYLEKRAKLGDKEAERQLGEAWRRTERKSGQFEFEGGLKELKQGKGEWKKLGKREVDKDEQ